MLQFEGGLEVRRETGDDDDPDTDSYEFPDPTLRLGVARNFELRLVADGLVYQDRGGASNRATGSDLSAGFKLRLMQQQSAWPALGALVELSFPTGSEAVTSGGFDPSLRALFQWGFAEHWNVVANLGFSAPTQGDDDPSRVFRLAPALSLELQLGSGLGSYVEYFGAYETGGNADEHGIDGGFTWLVNDDLMLDLWAGGGLNDAAPEWQVGAGASWRFRLWCP